MDTKALKKEFKRLCKEEKRPSYICKLLSVIIGVFAIAVIIAAFVLDYIPFYFTGAAIAFISAALDLIGDRSFKKEFADYLKTK